MGEVERERLIFGAIAVTMVKHATSWTACEDS